MGKYPCPRCYGKGINDEYNIFACEKCGGMGLYRDPSSLDNSYEKCPFCEGEGYFWKWVKTKCTFCLGEGSFD